MRFRQLFIWIAVLLWCTSTSAQSTTLNVGGYAKYLFSSTRYPFYNQRLNDHLLHLRLNTHWYPSENLQAALELRFRAFYGNSVEKIPNFKEFIRNKHERWKMDHFFWENSKSVGYGEVDRLWLDYTRGNLEITLGRQRIAWGTTLVWNVIDIFNPYDILDFDYEEKPGSDAIRLQYYTGAVSKVEFSYKPGKSARTTTWAGLWGFHAFEYDFFLLAGKSRNRWLVGGAWSGYIGDGGFRGEWLWSDAPAKSAPDPLPYYAYFIESFYLEQRHSFSASLSGDYTFSSSLYLHGEVLYNRIGKTRNAGLYLWEAPEVGLLSPARWSLFLEAGYDITPLLRGSGFAILNPIDHSYLFAPTLNYSALTNLDVMLLAFFPEGDSLTEFGGYGTSLFFRLKYSF